MKDVITVDERGCFVLPDQVRRALRIDLPAQFQLDIVEGKLELALISSQSGPASGSQEIPHDWRERQLLQIWDELGPAPEIDYDKL